MRKEGGDSGGAGSGDVANSSSLRGNNSDVEGGWARSLLLSHCLLLTRLLFLCPASSPHQALSSTPMVPLLPLTCLSTATHPPLLEIFLDSSQEPYSKPSGCLPTLPQRARSDNSRGNRRGWVWNRSLPLPLSLSTLGSQRHSPPTCFPPPSLPSTPTTTSSRSIHGGIGPDAPLLPTGVGSSCVNTPPLPNIPHRPWGGSIPQLPG
jgi:hypothetical protein